MTAGDLTADALFDRFHADMESLYRDYLFIEDKQGRVWRVQLIEPQMMGMGPSRSEH